MRVFFGENRRYNKEEGYGMLWNFVILGGSKEQKYSIWKSSLLQDE